MWLPESALGSLRGRLALGVGLGALLVLTLSFVAVHLLVRGELYAWLEEDLTERMHAIAEYAAAHPGRENVAEFMPQFRTRAHKDFFQVWDAGDKTLVRSDSSAGRDLPRPDALAATPTYRDLVLPDGHRGRAVARVFELPPGDGRIALTVVNAAETENLDALESRIHVTLLAVAVATVVAVLSIAIYSIARGLTPVSDFARSLEGVDPDDPGAKLDVVPLPTELHPVAMSFSALLDRLLEALAREKRYARNVAHELRNPLAEMRLLADVGLGSEEPGGCRAALRDVTAVAEEMEQIVESLMALTRYEAGLEVPAPDPVELGAELGKQVQAVSAAAQHRELVIHLLSPGEVWVHADSALVRRFLAILIGNAVAHAPRGTAVTVSLEREAVVTVANLAPQLRRDDVARLGERFYHVGAGESHAGLGLSLALAIAKVMGLQLTLDLRDDALFVVTVRGFQALVTAS